jgi:hypothetical protein
MKSIIIDASLDKVLLEKGFAIIPILNGEDTNSLHQFYLENHHSQVEEMYASAHSKDLNYRMKMSDSISSIVVPHLTYHLQNIDVLGGSFIIKGPSPKATLPPHQDWNIVDESRFRSFNLWLPLVNTTAENGGLKVIPGSHLWFSLYRGPNISSAFELIIDKLMPQLISLEVPAGSAVLYDHRLLHASGVNRSNYERIVVVLGIKEVKAPMFIYYRNGNKIDAYKCNTDFFMQQDPEEGPASLTLYQSFPWNFPSYRLKDIQKFTLTDASEKNLFSKIFSFFKSKAS